MNLRTRIKTDGSMIVEQTSGDHAGEFIIDCSSDKIIADGLRDVLDSLNDEISYQSRTDRMILRDLTAYYDFGAPDSVVKTGIRGLLFYLDDWSISGVTKALAADQVGGKTASAITESTSTSTRYLMNINSNTQGPGWCRVKCSYKPGPNYFSERYRIRPHGLATALLSLNLPTEGALLYPEEISPRGYLFYQAETAGIGSSEGFLIKPRGDGWIDAEWDVSLKGGGAYYTRGPALYLDPSGDTTGTLPGVILTLSNLSISQDLVSEVTPIFGRSTYSLRQNNTGSRPTLAPDTWFGGSSLYESIEASCSMSASLPSSTNYTVSAIVLCKNLRPVSNCQILSLAGTTSSIKLNCTTTGCWQIVRTDDLGIAQTQTTTYPIAPVPVCVTLSTNNSNIFLYVDGQLVDTMTVSGASSTITNFILFGGDSRSIVRNLAISNSTLDATSVQTLARTQRSEAKLPSTWPVVIISGQSNAYSFGTQNDLCANGVYTHPDTGAYYSDDNGYENTDHLWHTGIGGDYQVPCIGIRSGYMFEAAQTGLPCIAINSARAGTAISSWMTGGAALTQLQTSVSTAINYLGTHLINYDSFVWVQGEQEATYGDSSYLEHLRTLRTTIRSTYGSTVKFCLLRLNRWFLDDATNYPYASNIQAAQDSFAAEDTNTYIAECDGGQYLDYCIHYPNRMRHEIGRRLFKAKNQQYPTIEILNPDYPQRGTWTTGGYWDVENNIVKSGSTITSIASREGSAVLTASGSPTLVTTWSANSRKAISFASATDYLSLVDGTLFGNFSGDATSIILFAQFKTSTSPSGTIISLADSDASDIACQFILNTTTNLNAIRTQTTTTTNARTIAASTYYTQVYVLDGTNCYLIDSTGIRAAVTENAASMTVDRLQINAIASSGGGVQMLRRWGLKRPASNYPIGEAAELYTMLSGLG